MFRPTRLTAEGFRGFREAEEFNFDQPMTELFGDNRSCKSSTLNALEWAIFGDACAGKQTGIRERVGWVIANQHLPSPTVRVRLEMQGPDGNYVFVRMLHRLPKRAAIQETLVLTLPDGTSLTNEAAINFLGGLLQSSFRDFLTTVYQHQEVIRAVITQEPKERNDAIDRLLGLSDQRNFLGALDAADLRGRQKDITKDFGAFVEQIQAGLAARENDLVATRKESGEAGLARNQLTCKYALQAAGSVQETLQAFAMEAELNLPDLAIPNDWHDLTEFVKITKPAISQMRSQVPGIEEQEVLLKGQHQLLSVKMALEALRQQWADLGIVRRDLDNENGSHGEVNAKIAETLVNLESEQAKLRATNGQAAVVKEAIEFIDTAGNVDPPCPVCETVVPGLAHKLKEMWTTKLKSLVESITVKINTLNARLKEIRGIAVQYQKLNDDGELLQEDQARLRDKTVKLLKISLPDDSDPLSLIIAELQRLDSRLQQLGRAIQERQERLDSIEHSLSRVRLILDYLYLDEKKQVLETIQESDAFKQMELIRDQFAEFVEDVDAIKNAVAEVAREEAATKLTTAGKTIDEYFRQLSRNPAVPELKLAILSDKRTRRNSYEITDHNGKDLTPILSQGDLNVLALAIFLGLAVTSKESGKFGFLVLDDPSQSLGTEHKKQLAQLLDKVAQHKQLIVATMDTEFHDCLNATFTKLKKVYRFGNWTPEEGPKITTLETGGSGTRSGQASKKKSPECARR